MTNPSVQPPFTNLQMELLRLFAKQLPEKDLLAIRDLIAQYLLERTFELADAAWDAKGYSLHVSDVRDRLLAPLSET